MCSHVWSTSGESGRVYRHQRENHSGMRRDHMMRERGREEEDREDEGMSAVDKNISII